MTYSPGDDVHWTCPACGADNVHSEENTSIELVRLLELSRLVRLLELSRLVRLLELSRLIAAKIARNRPAIYSPPKGKSCTST